MTNPATGLTAGSYMVTITNNNGCQTSTSTTLSEPSLLSAGLVSLSQHNGYNISCNGGSNGTASASSTGGSGGNNYLWSNG